MTPFVPMTKRAPFRPVGARRATEPPPAPEPAPVAPAPPLEKVDVDALVRRALAEGRAEGERTAAEALAAERAEVARQAALLEAALAEIAGARKAALAVATRDVASVVEVLAHRVVERSLAVHPDALPRIVRECVALVPDHGNVRVRVAPGHVAALAAVLAPEWAARVEADRTIEAGCRVEAQHATIDATLAAADAGVRSATEAWLAAEEPA